MSRQDNSDPLPYVQVDRAVKPKAVLLANAIGVTTQHALGSLVEWWELCGDPRELETIVAATKVGEEPAVILQADDAQLRFKLASGRDVEPVVLVRLGLLEQLPGGFRVRGMSRYFEPIERRMQKRECGRLGGLASAKARMEANGTSQPTSGRSDAASEPASAVVEQVVQHHRSTTEAPPKHRRSTTEDSGQRSAVSGQLQLEKLAGEPPPAAVKEPRKPKPEKPTDPRHAPLRLRLVEIFLTVRGAAYPFGGHDGRLVTDLLAIAPPEAIASAWERALGSGTYPTVSMLSELKARFGHFVGTGPPPPGPRAPAYDPNQGIIRSGVTPSASREDPFPWNQEQR